MTTTKKHHGIRIKSPLCALMTVLLIVLVFVVTGCGKGDRSKVGEAGHKGEEAGHKENGHDDHQDEEPGVVRLSQEKIKSSGIEVLKVVPAALSIPLTATAIIELNADRTSRVSSRVTGKVSRLLASLGDRVKAGQALALMDSFELDQMWSEYAKMKGRHELAARNLQREEALFEKKVAPEKDVLKARQELKEAEADLTLSKERFRLLGVDIAILGQQKSKGGNGHPLIPILTLVGGVVIEKSVTQGETVSPEKVLFIVADLSTLWVLIDIYEKDLSKVVAGTPVSISVASFPDRQFQGKITYLSDVIDDKTRAARARVVVDNKMGLLKPGMFATVQITVKNSNTGKAIVIPEQSVFLDGSERYVFVREEGSKFMAKRVVVGPVSGEKIEIKEGLKEGDVVVIKGVFSLKSEFKKETLDVHGH